MSDPVIRFESVGKRYPQYHHITAGFKPFLFRWLCRLGRTGSETFEALRAVTFEVRPGETLGIIGRNGSGKSTVLGLIAGVLRPTSGTVRVRGRVAPLLELGAGFHPELTGRENIFLNGILLGLTRAEVARKLDAIIAFSELGEFIHEPIRIYSSGMLARLGFAVISSLDPEILLVDEILAVGDMDFQKKCVDRALEFKRRGVTIIYVSHALDQVQELSDRALWLDEHTVQAWGNPAEVVDAYRRHSSPQRGPDGGRPEAPGGEAP